MVYAAVAAVTCWLWLFFRVLGHAIHCLEDPYEAPEISPRKALFWMLVLAMSAAAIVRELIAPLAGAV